MARDYYDETRESPAIKQTLKDAQATTDLNKQPVQQPALMNQPDMQDYEIQAGIKQYPQNVGVAEDTVEQIRNDKIAEGERKATSTPNKIITPTDSTQRPAATASVYPNQQQGYRVTSDKEGNPIKPPAPGEEIPATLKAQSDWSAEGKYMYIPNHPKAVNGYVKLSKGDVLYARKKMGLPVEQPTATAPVVPAPTPTPVAPQPEAPKAAPTDVPAQSTDSQATMKQYQSAMREARKANNRFKQLKRQYVEEQQQIKTDAEGNKEYRLNQSKMKFKSDLQAVQKEYDAAYAKASALYKQLRGV